MSFVKYVLSLVFIMILAACGGGGGSAGTSSGSAVVVAPLITTAPAALTVAVGAVQDYRISGGKAPYQVSSSNVQVSLASVSDTSLKITGIATGSSNVVVTDAAGATLTISVTVTAGSSAALFTNAPASVNITNGQTENYTITGGVQPYAATSNDTSVIQSSVTGSSLAIRAASGGTANVTVSDAAGATLSIKVTAGSSTSFSINAPNAVTIAAGSTAPYILSGGATPYAVVSSDVRVVKANISGAVVNVEGAGGGSAALQLTDAAGAKLTLAVTVGSTGVAVSQDPVLKSASLKDTAGIVTSSISATGYTLLSVTLTDPSGNGLANQVIDVAGNALQVIFPEGGTGLTNSSGVATVKVARASLVAFGAGALTVTHNYKVGALSTYPDGSTPPTANKVISTYVGYQLSANNITLVNMDVGASTLAAYGTRQISVQANINGVTSVTPVQVNFTATCGQVSPVTASTNSSGLVAASYTASDAVGAAANTLGCSGKTVEISASTSGAAVVTKTLTITAAPATNVSFDGVDRSRIFLANSGGPTQAVASFKLVNARNDALPGQDITLTLKTLGGGVPKASFGTVGNIGSITVTTDSFGKVSVPVFSGTVPTNVLVNAALASNSLIQTDSAVLTIASGRPAQGQVSLAVGQFAIRGFNFDGGETTVTLSLADRQGNPVPDGTAVNFVTEGGVMIPPVCTTGGVAGDSQCSVKIRSQNPRPANGLVSILAYAAGEEDFIDANFNNVYDCGEAWTDLGNAYRDDAATANGAINAFVTGQFSVPRSASLSSCATGVAPTPQAGDSVWGAADVRRQAVIAFSTDDFTINGATWTSAVDPQWNSARVATQLNLSISDLNGNSIPTGSSIAVAVTDNSPKLPTDGAVPPVLGTCIATGQSYKAVPNSLVPLSLSIYLKECVAGDQIQVTVTAPGLTKSLNFTVPN